MDRISTSIDRSNCRRRSRHTSQFETKRGRADLSWIAASVSESRRTRGPCGLLGQLLPASRRGLAVAAASEPGRPRPRSSSSGSQPAACRSSCRSTVGDARLSWDECSERIATQLLPALDKAALVPLSPKYKVSPGSTRRVAVVLSMHRFK